MSESTKIFLEYSKNIVFSKLFMYDSFYKALT